MSNSAATNIEVENQIGRLKPKFNPLVVVALLAVFVGVGCAFCQQAKINNLQHERIMQQSILPAGGGTGPTLAPGGPRPAVSPSPGGPGPTVRPGGPNMASPPPRPQPRAQPEIPGTYDDDEPFLESDTPQGGKEGKVEARLLAQRSQVKLGEKTVLPAMYQVNSSGGDRTSVDLICVIDVSGSMTGQKIELVKSTMKYIVETLTPSDRLSIVTFQSSAKRITPLMAGTKENQVILNKHIDQIRAGGGTIIPNGMNVAFKVMRDRKLQNKATSIFLLSDGLDNEGNAQFRVKDALGQSKNKKLGVFSIHSFGFGSDHDEQMMNDIALLRDGSFYFIKELNTLDEAFSNALGGIISLAASQVILNVHCISEGLLEGTKITKVYGDKWEKISEKQYKIRITQLISDVSKQFVFELTIPAIQGEVAAEERSQVVVEGMMQAKVINGPQVDQPSSLSITLIDYNDQMVDDENVEVIESYLRVRAAEAIEKSIKLAEDNMFSEAQRLLADMINMIRNNKKARKDKMQVLLKDLQRIKQKLSAQDWEREGRKYALNAQGSHNNQGGFAYANTVQSSMVAQRAALKTQP